MKWIYFFLTFQYQARSYDIDSNLIYKHKPVNFNCHSCITFNVLIKNSHIYTLNYNLKSLKRKNSDELYKFRIGHNYYINHREEPLKYKMIDGIDDVMSLKWLSGWSSHSSQSVSVAGWLSGCVDFASRVAHPLPTITSIITYCNIIHTHTYCIYIYMCVCVCVCVYTVSTPHTGL